MNSHIKVRRELGEDVSIAKVMKAILVREYDDIRSLKNVFLALAQAVRERALTLNSRVQEPDHRSRKVYYLSMEFLIGRLLRNYVLNLDLEEEVNAALDPFGLKLTDLEDMEQDAGLGNGGLGRLAACFLDSSASLNLPVTGYGLRYRYGMFSQKIDKGYQAEEPDTWLYDGYPWEARRIDKAQTVSFYGRCVRQTDSDGREHVRLVDAEEVRAVPYDIPIPGYQNNRVNKLRLWRAEVSTGFNLIAFNAGEHTSAVAANNHAEAISLVLYPGDESLEGKRLRLRQQYFLCSATLKDILASWTEIHGRDFTEFTASNVFQLNDTHPVCAIPELMRLLIDEHLLEWDEAWAITQQCMAYTNHTLLPEALEQWPTSLFEELLPRLFEIVQEIDRRFNFQLRQTYPEDAARHERMSIISDGDHPQIRMAHLGIVGSRSVNGVAELHSSLLRETLFRDFHELSPNLFNNKTNGVTHRRWLQSCNRELAELIGEAIGDEWTRRPLALSKLEAFAEDDEFRKRWRLVREVKKQQLSAMLWQQAGFELDTSALLDVQVKRIHEYKRQLLNILHVVHLHQELKAGQSIAVPRTVLMAGKAAPGYAIAKMIIKLANDVAHHVNRDTQTHEKLKFLFLPNYNVSAMEKICPAADLSSQISTAGKEASGTGNMKFMLNGSLTIGTMDGANIEIQQAVGESHFFQFGLTAAEISELRTRYNPNEFVERSVKLKHVIEMLQSGAYSVDDSDVANHLVHAILQRSDPWMTAADFDSFVSRQADVAQAFNDHSGWIRSSILNTSASGRFSSDRTIQNYANDIWQISTT